MKKIKILIIYPPISKKERYSSDIGEAGGEQIPLGIYCIASYLRKNNYSVKAYDAEALKMSSDQIVSEAKRYKPDFIGIGSTTVAFHRAVEVATELKKHFPKTQILLGGPHVTSNPEHALSFKAFDVGIMREGEITVIEVLQKLMHNKDLSFVHGVAYRDKKNIVRVTPPREYIRNLDLLPFPAYDLIPNIDIYAPPPSNYKNLPVINVITSRGCPNNCTFCDRNVFGQIYREMSAKKVFLLLKHLWGKYHFKEIAFVDDTFLINKRRLHDLFDMLDEAGIHFSWTCMSRVNIVDKNTLIYIKNKGCWHISFGVESGDQKILEIIKKHISLQQVTSVTDWCHELEIKTKGFFIIGHPGDTVKTIDETITFACALKIDDIVTTINTPIPGSPQYGFIHKFGTFDNTDWSQFNYWRPVFVPYGLTKEILLKKQKEMYRRFYLRPRILLRYIKSFTGKGGVRRLLSVAKASKYLIAPQNIN